MKLVTDEKNQVFYWVDAEGNLLSPHFDYEEDADQWFLNNFEIKKHETDNFYLLQSKYRL